MSDEPPWEQLDRRAVAQAVLAALGIPAISSLPAALALADRGVGVLGTLLIAAGLFAVVLSAIAVYEALRRARTWFRVTDERVELRSELIHRRHSSVRRDRIRTVDVSAGPAHRLLGLAKVEIGTAQEAGSGGDRLTLDPVSRARAEMLRQELLRRGPAPAGSGAGPAAGPSARDGASAPAGSGRAAAAPRAGAEAGSVPGRFEPGAGAAAGSVPGRFVPGAARPAGEAIAVLDPRWIRFAPLSVATLALGVAAAGAIWQGAQWVGLDDDIGDRAERLVHAWQLGVLLSLVLVAAGAIGTLAVFVEQWFGFRLEREPDGTLQQRRGLLTTRSLTLEESRLRGVELVEPLAVRAAGGARVEAVATGIGKGDGDARAQRATLLPAAPRALAWRVADEVLAAGEWPAPVTLAGVPLRPHPPAARRRRHTRAFALLAIAVGVPLVLGAATDDETPLVVAALIGMAGAPIGLWFARDAYRSLGHALTARHLVVRSGSLRRGTVALERSGVIGWTITRSPLQRRAGLATVTATTAAGRGAYPLLDVDVEAGVAFADEATPGLLAPFVVEKGPE